LTVIQDILLITIYFSDRNNSTLEKKVGQATYFPCLPILAPQTGRNSNRLVKQLKFLCELSAAY